MPAKDIIVFERCGYYNDDNEPELDFVLVQQMVPAGAIPLAIATQSDFAVIRGRYFSAEEVAIFAMRHSGWSYPPIP